MHLLKRVVRLLVGFALVALFCALVYLVAYKAELVGGRTVPDVVGWRAERARDELEGHGFSVELVDAGSSDQDGGMVVSTTPSAGQRVDTAEPVEVYVAGE